MARILYFGKLADLTGMSEELQTLPESVASTGALRAWIEERFDTGGAFLSPENRIALNDEIVAEPAELGQADHIAFLPPVGGG